MKTCHAKLSLFSNEGLGGATTDIYCTQPEGHITMHLADESCPEYKGSVIILWEGDMRTLEEEERDNEVK